MYLPLTGPDKIAESHHLGYIVRRIFFPGKNFDDMANIATAAMIIEASPFFSCRYFELGKKVH